MAAIKSRGAKLPSLGGKGTVESLGVDMDPSVIGYARVRVGPYGFICSPTSLLALPEPYRSACSLTSLLTFAYRYEQICSLAGIGAVITPEKYACSVVSVYSVGVA